MEHLRVVAVHYYFNLAIFFAIFNPDGAIALKGRGAAALHRHMPFGDLVLQNRSASLSRRGARLACTSRLQEATNDHSLHPPRAYCFAKSFATACRTAEATPGVASPSQRRDPQAAIGPGTIFSAIFDQLFYFYRPTRPRLE